MSDKPKCGCGNTQNPDGFCDGSHNNQVCLINLNVDAETLKTLMDFVMVLITIK